MLCQACERNENKILRQAPLRRRHFAFFHCWASHAAQRHLSTRSSDKKQALGLTMYVQGISPVLRRAPLPTGKRYRRRSGRHNGTLPVLFWIIVSLFRFCLFARSFLLSAFLRRRYLIRRLSSKREALVVGIVHGRNIRLTLTALHSFRFRYPNPAFVRSTRRFVLYPFPLAVPRMNGKKNGGEKKPDQFVWGASRGNLQPVK